MKARTALKTKSGLRYYVARTKAFFGKIFGSKSLKRGRKNEQRALILVEQLYKAGMIPHVDGQRPYITKPFSTLDMKGHDIVIPTLRGEIGIQIKSSKRGFNKFQAEQRKRHSRQFIPCIVVNKNNSDEAIKRIISRLVWKDFNRLEERK